ncbi:MAG: nickel/cobalt transporter [Rhizobiales bacterium]|nr:nickel/cobalt transporter [Hyphomicrobiales bacterium]
MKHVRILMLILAALFCFCLSEPAQAEKQSPFGLGAPQETSPVGEGFLRERLVWVYSQQAAFYKQLTGFVKRAKTDGSAVWTLIGLSFLYGVLHAAGPGHGKVVISSYMLANEASARRGVSISFLSAFMQGLVAILLIGAAVFVFNLTSVRISLATRWFEIISYGLIAALGLYLVWQKGIEPALTAYRQKRTIRARDQKLHQHGAHHAHHDHAQHGHGNHHHHAHNHSHDHAHDHDHDAHCGCGGHAADPAALTKPLTLRSAWAAIAAVGFRPCSGALIVLLFAASQGLFLVGVVSTFAMALGTAITVTILATLAITAKSMASAYLDRGGEARWVFKAIELGGASFVLLLGLTLLSAALFG